MSAIVILLLEDSDSDAERILAALSEGGPACRVHRARNRRGLVAGLAGGAVDLILAGGGLPDLDARSILDAARARRPAVPVVAIPRDLRRIGAAVEQALIYREALAAGRRKDELLARAAHELRTPLNAMLGWASMLRTRRLDEAARARALETIERNARAQARLIEDLLDVSRMLTGTLRLEVIEVELCPAVVAAVEAGRPAAEAKGITVSAALDDTAGSVAGDPGRLRQVLHELIANAVRATPPGGRVGVRLARDGAHVEITVSDTGCGIRVDRLPHLFNAFPRAGSASSSPGPSSPVLSGSARHGSLGVGLSIARHLIEAHGGVISAESDGEGRGATFTVRLPLLPTEWTPRSGRHDTRDASPLSSDRP